MDPDQYYTEDVFRIKEIEFSLLSDEETKRMSAVKQDPFGINLAESYNKYEPQKGGLVDLRLGTSDPYLKCNTCGLNMEDCPGHFGHHELPDYFFLFGFLNNLKVVLQCVCLNCSKLLVENNEELYEKLQNKKGIYRLNEIKEKANSEEFDISEEELKKEVKSEPESDPAEEKEDKEQPEQPKSEKKESSEQTSMSDNPEFAL